MSQKTKLEAYVASKVKVLDEHARPSKASGASTEVGDTYNRIFVIECKEKHTRDNVIMEFKVWNKLQESIPIGSGKTAFYVTENKAKKKFVVIDIDDFFRLIQEKK